MKELKKADKAN